MPHDSRYKFVCLPTMVPTGDTCATAETVCPHFRYFDPPVGCVLGFRDPDPDEKKLPKEEKARRKMGVYMKPEICNKMKEVPTNEKSS